MALNAGIDMSMTASSTTFCTVTKELVIEGYLSESVIDAAVLKILRLKFDLGLFENPYPRNDRFNRIGSASHKAEALEATRESIVLLKNDGILPLKSAPKKILVVGPQSHSKRNLAGGWTINWNGGDEAQFPATMPTLYSAIKSTFSKSNVDTSATTDNGKIDLVKLAAADLVILALGEPPYAEGTGNIQDLNLPLAQQQLIAEVQKAGKPNIMIMIAGRPRIVNTYLPKSNAFIHAGLPGEQGGQAIADILSGSANPSGKLALTYPAEVGHITPYNARVHEKYSYEFPFGFGLSYTHFTYSNLKVSDSIVNITY
jgi:beta-glucosidase